MGKRTNRGDRPGVLHYLTINVRDNMHPFSRDIYAREVLRVLRLHCDTHPARLVAYCAMPDHLHGIVNPRDGEIMRFVKNFKADVTRAVAHIAEEIHHIAALKWLYHTADGHPQLWQDGKHNFHLWSERLIWQKIDYIHRNPIRAGLVESADEYPYTSFRAIHHLEGEVIVPIDLEWWWEDEDFIPFLLAKSE